MPKRAAPAKIKLSWQLKIELLDVTPTVWRRLIVPETIKLPKLDFRDVKLDNDVVCDEDREESTMLVDFELAGSGDPRGG